MITKAPIAIGAGAIYPYSEALVEECARVDRYGEPYNLARVVGSEIKRVWVPRNMAIGGVNLVSDGQDAIFKSKFIPRNEEQLRVISEIVQLTAKGASFVVEAPTGFGKTVCAMDAIAKIGKKTLVVVTKEDIRAQWRDAAKMILGITDGPNGDIGYIQGDTCQITGRKLVIGLIQSLAKEARYNESLFKEFGLVVWDEVHRVAAEFFSQSAYRVPAALRLGLSATPDRKDGRDEVLRAHIGPIRVRAHTLPMTPRVIARKTSWKLPMTRVKGKIVPLPHSAGKCGHIINLLVKDFGRNKMIAMFVGQAFSKGRNILVQSDRKDHLEELASMITSHGVPPAEIGYYIGGLTEKQRDIAKGKSVIMACVSEDTECLTLDGWKTHNQLKTGELVASYNLEKKVIEYQPLLGIHTYVYEGSMCHVDRKSADLLLTWNHRNVVENRKGIQRVVRSDELQRSHRIRVFAPMQYPEEKGIGVQLAALMGWVIAEGTYHDGGANGVKIYQNRGSKANEIRALLLSLNFEFSERYRDEDMKQMEFRIASKGGAAVVRGLSPNKKLTKQLVSLPRVEAQALFDALIDGDGHRRKDNGNLMFVQKDKETTDWFCILAMRLGYKPTVSEHTEKGNHTYRIYLGHTDLIYLGNGKQKVKAKKYKGVVWCPTTPNTTWVARRNGTVFITGNTYAMTAEATDIPWLDTLVMATPKSDIRQIVGRILRTYEGKKDPVVFDLIDPASHVFYGYWNSRRSWYVSINAEVDTQ